ncbi:MAG: Uma2 family endonuclease [Candidatus Rokubacteria bacterium]|nr:Uma2 family endonuclease [Candidatus Rokubacteria bacterium]
MASILKRPADDLWRLPRVRYERMVERGLLDSDDKVELLDGLLIAKEPQSDVHAAAMMAGQRVLERAFGGRYHVRIGCPIALDEYSEPEPDLAVVPGGPWDYKKGHPTRPVLAVEIAMTSRAKDRWLKGGLYARAGIADYWVVNLVDEVLEIYRQPVKTPARRYGWKYGSVKLLKRGAVASPLAAPRARVKVVDLLP